jgi:hypothetical protein
MLTVLLIVLLVVLLAGGGFAWGPGYRGTHGPALGGVLGVLLLIVVIVLALKLVGVVL